MTKYSTMDSAFGSELPTRERILISASELFAVQGYVGTSTRQIANAVGMQQPSLFHHFSTKSAIMHELLRYSLERPLRWKVFLEGTAASPAVKLYCYYFLDARHIVSSSYDIAGIDHGNITKMKDFKKWRPSLNELRAYRIHLIDEAVRAGEFIEWPIGLMQGSISSIILSLLQTERTIRLPAPRIDEVAHCVAGFLIRAMLTDTSTLSLLRESSEEIILALARPRSSAA